MVQRRLLRSLFRGLEGLSVSWLGKTSSRSRRGNTHDMPRSRGKKARANHRDETDSLWIRRTVGRIFGELERRAEERESHLSLIDMTRDWRGRLM